MTIGGNQYKEIHIVTKDDNLIASITDKDIIGKNGYKVICVPHEDCLGKKEDEKGIARPRGTDKARVIQVIETESLRGSGTENDMCRIVKQYWDFNGGLLAENDPCKTEQEQCYIGSPFDFSGIDCDQNTVQKHINEAICEILQEAEKDGKTRS